MGKTFTTDDLFESMQILINEEIKKVQYDNTILCSIVSIDNDTGDEYTVTDGNTTFTAYGDTGYIINNNVYVLIPGGDYNNKKIIVGKYVSDDTASFTYVSPMDSFLQLTGNLFIDVKDTNNHNVIAQEHTLLANKDVVANAKKENINHKNWNNNLIYNASGLACTLDWPVTFKHIGKLDTVNQKFSIGYDRLGISAQFKTNLSNHTVNSGSYGLLLVVNWTKKDESTNQITNKTSCLILDTTDMWGNPYKYETYFQQEKVFDISEVHELKDMDLYFYQLNDFLDSENLFIPHNVSLNNNELFNDTITNDYPDNLSVTDINIVLGHDISDVKGDTVYLYTSDSEQYNQNTAIQNNSNQVSGALYPETAAHEGNAKRIFARWIHKADALNYVAIDEDDELPNNCQVHWYRYRLDEDVSDANAGMFWEEITPQTNETYTWKDSDNNTHTGYRYYHGLNTVFLPDENLQKEQLKIIIIEEDETTAQNIEAEYSAEKKALALEKLTDDKASLEDYLARKQDADDKMANGENIDANEYDNIKKMISSLEKTIEANQLIYDTWETTKAKRLAAEAQTLYKSEILTFENSDTVANATTVKLVRDLTITCTDSFGGVYKIYNPLNGELMNGTEHNKTRQAKVNFKSVLTGTEELDKAETIRWYIPRNNTMIVPPVDGVEYNLVDKLGNEQDKLTVTEDYYIIERKFTGSLVQAEDGAFLDRSAVQTYRIANYFNENRNDNTIKCEVIRNTIIYGAEKDLIFGLSGSNGRDSTLILGLGNDYDEDGVLQEENAPAWTFAHTIEYAMATKWKDYAASELATWTNDDVRYVKIEQDDILIQELEVKKQELLDYIQKYQEYFNNNEYDVSIDDGVEEQAHTIKATQRLELNAKIFDYNNQELDITNIQWEYYCPAASNSNNSFNIVQYGDYVRVENAPSTQDNSKTYYYKESEDNYIAYAQNDSNWNVNNVYTRVTQPYIELIYGKTPAACILLCTASAAGKTYTGYLSVPLRRSRRYSYIDGATSVLYNSQGSSPTYYKDYYKLYDATEKPLENIVAVRNDEGLTDEQTKWLPTIKIAEGHHYLNPNTMFLKDVNYNCIVDLYQAVGMEPCYGNSRVYEANWRKNRFYVANGSTYVQDTASAYDSSKTYYQHSTVTTVNDTTNETTVQHVYTPISVGPANATHIYAKNKYYVYDVATQTYSLDYAGFNNTYGTQSPGDYNKNLFYYEPGNQIWLWRQPVLILQNRYSSPMLNKWDGSLTMDEENGTILSAMLGAGVKNSDNTFSGVLLGNVGLADDGVGHTGVYGYDHGEMSYGLKEDGTAFLGKATAAQLKFDGNKGIFQNRGYSTAGTGIQMVLDGNPDNEQYFSLKSDKNEFIRLSSFNSKNYITIKGSDGKVRFQVNDTATTIGGWVVTETTISKGSTTLSSQGYVETSDLYADGGKIGDWIIDSTSIRNTAGSVYLSSGSRDYNIYGASIYGGTIEGADLYIRHGNGYIDWVAGNTHPTVSGLNVATSAGIKSEGGITLSGTLEIYDGGPKIGTYYGLWSPGRDNSAQVSQEYSWYGIRSVSLSTSSKTFSGTCLTPDGTGSCSITIGSFPTGVSANIYRIGFKIIAGIITNVGISDNKSVSDGTTPNKSDYPIVWDSNSETGAKTDIGNRPTTGHCFDKGTLITMASGDLVAIEDIKVGDRVLSYNDKNGKLQESTVLTTNKISDTDILYDIILANDTTVSVTAAHPLLSNIGWVALNPAEALQEHHVQCQQLQKDMQLQTVIGLVAIDNIIARKCPAHYETYNIGVSGYHTYIANNIIAHNVIVKQEY